MYDIIIGRSEKDRQTHGTKGTVFIGRHYVKMGRTTSLSSNIYLDVSKSHVVFVCGKRGSGKCVTGDTLVTLENGNVIPIKDLENNNQKVLSLRADLKISCVKKTQFYKRKVKRVIEVRLRSGKIIRVTPEHPLLTVRGWQETQHIPINERIATPRILNTFGMSDLSESEVKIIAYLLAEGDKDIKKPLLFSNGFSIDDEFIIKDLEIALKDFDGKLLLTKICPMCYKINAKRLKRMIICYNNIKNKKRRLANRSKIIHEKTLTRTFLKRLKICYLDSESKFIPEEVMTLPKHKLALFLNRLFSCSGDIYKCKCGDKFGWKISYSSTSRKLTRQVQHLLIRFGIISELKERYTFLKNKSFLNYELTIGEKHIKTFINEIGFFGSKELKQTLFLKENAQINDGLNTDDLNAGIIPEEMWSVYGIKSVASVGKLINCEDPKALGISINNASSRQKLFQIAFGKNEFILDLMQSDIFWDEIVEKNILDGEFEVYDLGVPETHNFVANDIIVHNSYTMGVIAEGVSDLPEDVKQNLSVVLFDTMGVYWTMKYPNLKDDLLLEEWGMTGKGLDVVIFTPFGFYDDFKKKGIPTDFPFSIKPSEMSAEDWCISFEIPLTSQMGVLIERVVQRLKDEGKDYDIDDIIANVKIDDTIDMATKNAVENRFLATKTWGVFSKKGTQIKDIAKPGQVAVLDMSIYATMPNGWHIKNIVIGIVANKLFIERMTARRKEEFKEIQKSVHYFAEEKSEKKEYPLVWLVIDEAHEFLPNKGKTVATRPLVTILREGRQPGISLILASQQPGKIHTDVMTQADTVISHRITAKIDTEALGALMQTYMRRGLTDELDALPRVRGSAIIFDDTNEKLFPIKIRPRFTWHGGEEPSALPRVRRRI